MFVDIITYVLDVIVTFMYYLSFEESEVVIKLFFLLFLLLVICLVLLFSEFIIKRLKTLFSKTI